VFIFIISCSTSKDNFLNRKYHRINTKYNVLFNGNEALKVGKKILEEVYQDDFFNVISVEPILLRGENIDNSTIIPGFQRAEEKAVKAIQKHSMKIQNIQKNPLIDDSYILLGKARYYDRRFFPALEAFNYIMENYSKPKTFLEARIWREKTNIRLRNNDLAINNLRVFSKRLINKSKFSGILNASIGQAYLNKNRLDSAKYYIKKAAINEKKSNTKARYYYITGQLFEKLNDKDSAIWAFNQIKLIRKKIPRKFYINSIIKGLILDKDDGLEKKKIKLERLLKNYENKRFKHYLYTGLGQIFKNNGDDSLANNYFLLSQEFSKTDIHTKIYNYKSIIDYNFEKGDYINSGIYIDSLILLYNSGDIKRKILSRRKESLSGIIRYEKIVHETDSMIKLINMNLDERYSFFSSYINKRKKKQLDSLLNKKKKNKLSFLNFNGNKKFYFYNSNLVLLGKQKFKSSWGNRPNLDNWRIISQISSGSESLLKDENNLKAKNKIVYDTPEFLMSKAPNNKKQIDSILQLNENAYLQLGVIYKQKFSNYNLARDRFKKLLSKNPRSEIKVQALYHLYKINQNKDDSLANYYKSKILDNFPKTPFAILLSISNNYSNLEIQTNESLYYNLYKMYSRGEYIDLLIKISEIRAITSGTEIERKLALLRANTMGRIYGITIWKKELEYISLTYPESKEGKYSKDLILNILKLNDLEENKIIYKNYKWIFVFDNKDVDKLRLFYDKLKKVLFDTKVKWTISKDFYSIDQSFVVIHGLKDKKDKDKWMIDWSEDTKFIKELNNFVALSSEYRNFIKNKIYINN